MARGFVRSCLHKVPKLRPTYSMLLKHPWLASISKPSTICEDDEETDGLTDDDIPPASGENSFDREVADWVNGAIERKKSGLMGTSAKPALHAAPMDSVSPPSTPSANPLG